MLFERTIDLKDIYFIEIKTDRKSRTQKQDKLMIQYGELSFQEILEGVINIAVKTNEKRKYATLLNNLENMGYITVPPEFWKLFSKKTLRGYGEIAPRIQIINSIKTRVIPIFIQPRKDVKNSTIYSIYFEEFADILENSQDELGKILSKMLREWSNDPGLIDFSKQSI